MPRIISTTSPSTEYNYDFPMPPTSSLIIPSLPTRKPAHVLRRPRSPSPTHPSPPSSTKKYIPSTRAAEVSRLLDPAYANPHQGSGSGSTSSNSPLSVFVDHYGDLHDPDYRHFPIVVATRPKWEQHGVHDEYDEEDDDEDVFFYPSSRSKPITPTIPSYRPSYAYASYHYDVPHPSPSSYDSNALGGDDLEDSPFADDEEKKECSMRKRRRYSKSKSKAKSAEEKEGLAAKESAAATAASGEEPEYNPEEFDNDWTPTCSQSLRREWQAITLRLRFSLFRMKRRMKRRLGT